MFTYETTKVFIGLAVFGSMLAVVAHAMGFR
jgi:hypothetical protein